MTKFFDEAAWLRVIRYMATGDDPHRRYVRATTLRALISKSEADILTKAAALGAVDSIDRNGLVDSYVLGIAFGGLSNYPEYEAGILAIFNLTRDLNKLPIVQIGNQPVS